MNKYESVIILDSMLSKEELDNIVNKITTFLKENTELTNVEDIGIKRLAYEINKRKEGHYMIFKFNAESKIIGELERIYRISDEVMKFINVRIDD